MLSDSELAELNCLRAMRDRALEDDRAPAMTDKEIDRLLALQAREREAILKAARDAAEREEIEKSVRGVTRIALALDQQRAKS